MKVIIQLGLHQDLVESLLSDSSRERAEALIYCHLGLDKAIARALEDEEPELYDQEEEDE